MNPSFIRKQNQARLAKLREERRDKKVMMRKLQFDLSEIEREEQAILRENKNFRKMEQDDL